MLHFETWRELALAFVRVVAWRRGWTLETVHLAKSTRSMYVKLRHSCGRAVQVRFSDHRSRRLGPRVFSVRQAATARLRHLEDWLELVAASMT